MRVAEPVIEDLSPAPPPSEPNPLHLPAFRRIVAGFTINEFGNWIGDVALAILVFNRTGSALATAALFLVLRFLPALLGPLLTTRAEAIPAHVVLPAIFVTEAVIFVALAWTASHFSLALVLVLGAIDGVLAIAAGALMRGATAAMLMSDGTLRRGNAIINIGFSAGGALGPALAGVMIATLGVGSALLVDAASFALVAAILAFTQGLRLHRGPSSDWRDRFRAGAGAAWRQRAIRRLIVAEALALLFFNTIVPIEVVFAKHTLGAGDSGYGALLAAWGAGMVLGSIGFTRLKNVRLIVLLLLSTALVGLGYGGLAVSRTLAIACAFSAIGGLGNGAQWVAFVTLIQESIPETAQSTVMSLVSAVADTMLAVGFLLGGAIATIWSPRIAYATSAAGVLLVLSMFAAQLHDSTVTRHESASEAP